MAAALLGKSVGLIALILLLHGCHAFKVREHQASVEHQHRATCASIFGRCTEKSPSSRKWHETTAQRLASFRRPPAEVTSGEDNDTGAPRGKVEKTGRPVDRKTWRSTELDDDDDEAVVEVEEDTAEVVSGRDPEDSGEKQVRKVRRSVELDDKDDETDSDSGVEVSLRKSSGEDVTRTKKSVVLDEDSEDDEEEEEDETEVSEDAEDEEEEDEEEEEEDDDEGESKASAPPLRKLEKVRHADKDKVRSVERSSIEKPTVEEKKHVEPAKVVPTEKVPVALEKPIETSKKVEPPKVTKSVSESSKPKSMPKEEKKEKVPVRAETKSPPTTRGQLKQPAEAKRIDKEAKPKTKTHVGAPYTLADLNDAILRVPTFVPNFTAVEDFECQQHGKIFLRQLRGYKLWALQMLDSGAKIPSSLLRGNFNQLGDFDQCLGVLAHVKLNDTTIKVQGKYCLANVDMYATHPDMKLPVHLMQARNLIRSMMRDTGHFVPRFTTIKWALCLPAACSAEHAQRALEQTLNDYNNTVGVRFVIDVDPNMCYVKQTSRTYSKETIGVLYFYAMVVCLVIVATLRDYIVASNGKANYSERIIMSFSLRRTMKSLWDSKVSNADVTCIHGIRTIGMIMLYSAHKVMPLSMIPIANRIELTELTNSLALTPIRAVTTFTESFLLISGVLTAYNMAHEFTVRGEIRWFCRFITRYIRLTSPLLAVLFWYAFVMEHTGSGPQWNNIIMKNAELCKSNAWTNFLYIQNFFPFLEMCATHTHQLALDMQLSLLAPMLVFFLEIKPIIGVLMIFFFILSSATFRYVAGVSNSLSLIIYNGMSSRQIIKTAELTYSVSWHRTTPYAMGVGLGVLLYHTKKDVKIHKVFVVLGWLIATTLLLWSLYSPWRMSRKDYVYNVEDATNYAVFYPVSCSLAVCWIIFACHTNNGGIVNRILTNYWCIVFSRMSYAIYLTQFVVFFYNVGSTRYPATYSTYKLIDQLEVAIVIVVSMILTLLFDIPMQEVRKVIMETTDVSREGPSDKKSSPETGKQTEKLEKAEQTQKKAFEEDEVASTGWDWQKDIVNVSKSYGNEIVEDEEQVSMPILKKPSGRRQSFIAHDPIEDDTIPTWDQRLSREEEYRERGRRNGQRDYQDSDDESEHSRMQPRRSLSRSFDAKRMSTLDRDEEEYRRRRGEEEDRRLRRESRGRSAIRDDDYRSWEFVAKERSSSRGPDPKRFSSKSDESAQRQSRPLTSETKRVLDSEEQPTKRRQPSVEPRISDEEDWESELRIRRKQFMEKLAKEEESVDEEDLSSLRRRSSAEGKLALLKDPSADDNMDSWTISVGSRVAQLGSSQERSEAEEEVYLRREYREKAPPMREDTQSEEEVIWDASKKRFYIGTDQTPSTSVEEDEDNFVLTKDSRRISLQDLSKLSQEDSDLAESEWNVVKRDSNETQPRSLGLFKRESIIKSQASEEDPEYLLPERPKLVQQEREHPFKKAWQMQKSRSEEDGSYSIKEAKEQSKTRERKNDESSSVKRESSGEQYEDGGSFADDECEPITLPRSRSTDTEETKTDSRSEIEETESVSTERSKSISIEDNIIISGDVEEEDLKFGWPSEAEADDDYDSSLRMQSEDTDSNWDEDDT